MTKFQDDIVNNPGFLGATLKGYREEVLREKEARDQQMENLFQEMVARLTTQDANASPCP